MDVDDPEPKAVAGETRINAQAGPSSQPDVPVVFLPPAAPARRKPPLDSTQDLISRFQLLQSYDKYVRPYVHPSGSGEPQSGSTHANGAAPSPAHGYSASTPGGVDKGKGREVPLGAPPMSSMGAATPGADGGDGDDGDEEGGKGDNKKQKNTYRHLIKGIPGKHSTKKDDYLQTMMLVPPKQRIQISKLDLRTQREAFSVSLDGLKGWNINALVAESAQAREDRKKRKELKKLAKAQAQAGILLPGSGPGPLPTLSTSAAPTPGVRQPQTPASVGVGTPRPLGAGPGPPAGHVGTPGHAPRSATPVPRPGSGMKKRQLEDDGGGGVGGGGGGGGQGGVKRGLPPPGSGGTKSGAGMPRPAKRPRTDGTPHQMGLPAIPQQQPTPQGV